MTGRVTLRLPSFWLHNGGRKELRARLIFVSRFRHTNIYYLPTRLRWRTGTCTRFLEAPLGLVSSGQWCQSRTPSTQDWCHQLADVWGPMIQESCEDPAGAVWAVRDRVSCEEARRDVCAMRGRVPTTSPTVWEAYSCSDCSGGTSVGFSSFIVFLIPVGENQNSQGSQNWNNTVWYSKTPNMLGERKKLVWELKKELLTLTANGLFEIIQQIQLPGLDSSTALKEDEESCFDYLCLCSMKVYSIKKMKGFHSC